jgi:hypothetical protein
MTTHSRRLMLLAAPAGLIALSGCAGAPAPTPAAPAEQPEIVEAMEVDIVAVVESVDQRAREVLLRGPEGGLLTVRVGSQVRNLNRVRAGDRLAIRYRRSVAVFLAPHGADGPPDAQAVIAAERAARDQRPAGAVGTLVAVRVVVTEVDRRRNTVTFVGPRNIPRTVHVTDPEMRRRLRTLTPGTRLDILYEEALALSVRPAPR